MYSLHRIGSVYENLALHIGVHEGEDHTGETIGIMRVTPWEAIVVATDVAVKAADVEVGFMDQFQWSADHNRRVLSGNDSSRRSRQIFPRRTDILMSVRSTEAETGQDERMKKVFLMGRSEAGKTSLTQALKGEELHYHKTQYTNSNEDTIDSPGEYAESKHFSVGTGVLFF